MTYRAWWAARRLLYEERFGSLVRADEQQQRAREAKLRADYLRSIEYLKKQQAEHGSG
jgi:hypothetical protein